YFRDGDEEFALDAGGDGVDIRKKYVGESLPKVYRRTFAQDNPSSLFREARDVTAFYRPAIDFNMNLSTQLNDTSMKYTVKLCHGTKGWSPVAEMEWVVDGEQGYVNLVGRNLGVNTLYIVGRYEDDKVYPVTVPFFVYENGNIHE